MESSDKHLRAIRSFVRREGKLTKGQLNALSELYPTLGVPLSNSKVNFAELFGRDAPVVMEIGFGNGLSLADMAEATPTQNYFGVEVHRPGVGSLLVQVKKRGLTNVRVSQDDAVEVLKQQVQDASLDRLQIFFPDPWHKKRHHKRRLIQPEFVTLVCQKLKHQGVLHIATDWQNYAEHILEVLNNASQVNNTSDQAHGYAVRPEYRPVTKYEKRGERLGHGVWDLIFTKALANDN